VAGTPEQVPQQLVAGDSWAWLRALADYPAPTWSATWYFENGSQAFEILATASGTSHAGALAAAQTGSRQPGRFKWALRVTDGTTAKTVERGEVEILVDPAKAGTFDHRTTAEKMVEALRALSLRRAQSGQTSVTIDNVSMTFDTMAEVIKALNYWEQQLASERKAAGLVRGGGRTIRVRFGRP
jgi:hypothetical protein